MSNYRRRHEALNPEKVLCPELKASKLPQSLFIYFIEKEAITKSSNTKKHPSRVKQELEPNAETLEEP